MDKMTRFGPSGMSAAYPGKKKLGAVGYPAWLKENGLTAYEYSFGRGVQMSVLRAQELGDAADEAGISMSAHAPYYINLASNEAERIEASIEHLRKTAVVASAMRAKRVVFHPGARGKLSEKEAIENTRKGIESAVAALKREGLLTCWLCPETMGKSAQVGDLEQTIAFCMIDECLLPCIDFGHLHARSLGRFGSREDFARALDALENVLGVERAKQVHIHFSRIEYTKAGEKKHWNYEDVQFGPAFDPLAAELAERRYEATVICESQGHMAEDAMIFKRIYEEAMK
ncbi:MAG: TIM barrel protein [Clostridia bacterium]|nr:TIM barrel protein [Clostridia bacterium]